MSTEAMQGFRAVQKDLLEKHGDTVFYKSEKGVVRLPPKCTLQKDALKMKSVG